MGFINFNKSKNFNEALTLSKNNTETLYFPTDNSTIVKNGKVIGIASATSPINYSNSTGVVSHANSGVTAGTLGNKSSVTAEFGRSFSIPYATVNSTGHITAMGLTSVTLPSVDDIYEHIQELTDQIAYLTEYIEDILSYTYCGM